MSTPEVETRARQMGWMPKEQFRGDPEKWVEASVFVERGETFVPYLKANNRKLESKVETLSQQLATLQRTSEEQIAALREYNTEFNREKVSAQRKELVAGIKAARDAGDVETEVQLQDKLAETRRALNDTQDSTTVQEQPRPQTKPDSLAPTAEVKAAFEAFQERHTWYEEDPMMRSAFIGTMQANIQDPEFMKLPVEDRFARTAEMVERRFGAAPTKRSSKYEGSSGGGGPESGSTSKEKGYAELPQEAKDGCARYESKLVGPNKTYKKVEDWQKKFAADYWRNNLNG